MALQTNKNKIMWEFYATPLDVLYFILSVSVAFLTLFIILTLWRIIRILRGVDHITSRTKDTVDLINHYLWQPIKIVSEWIEKSKTKADETLKKAASKARKKDEA